MLIPIGVLAAGSIFAGFPFKELFAGNSVEEFFRESLKMKSAHHRGHGEHSGVDQAVADGDDGDRLRDVPTCSISAGPYMPVELARQHQMLYQFLLNKWYFDELYDFIFVRPAKWLGRFLWKVGDG